MKLRTYLKRNKLTQVKFARRLGVSKQWVSAICNGSHPGRKRIIKIIKLTSGQVTIDDL